MNMPIQEADRASVEARLAALAQRAREEMNALSFATKPWVIPHVEADRAIPDVVILGAGQSGLVLGHALMRRGVRNILILDRNPEGYEGVWDTYARNYEIRSPKEVTGAELGFPSLSIRSWFIATHGREAWDAIERVPRVDWMNYLRWYRSVVDLPIRNGVEATDIDFDPEGVTLTCADGQTIRARYLVLATGMDGGGGWITPDFIREALPRDRFNHSCEIYDASRFAGLDVGVLGAGAAAFDSAVAALDAGARRVDMFMRRPTLPMIDVAREFETGGLLNHGHELPDAIKWRLASFSAGLSQSPARHHFLKAMGFPNFQLHMGAPWDRVGMEGDRILVSTPKGDFRFDHAIAATGVTVDMAKRPELARLAAGAALWADRFTPPADDPAPARLLFPYLDRDFRFQQKTPGCAPGIDRIFAYNALAPLSMGVMSAVSISSHRFGAPRITDGITRALFRDQVESVIPTLAAYDVPAIELTPEVRAKLGM